MFRILVILFILVPITEIAVFIEVGDALGLGMTLFIVIATAILGVNLLKQQGFKAWRDIQLSMAQGNLPAVEMAAAAQLLFAGGLLLTPGFVTDMIGFILMIPQVRRALATKMIAKGMLAAKSAHTRYSSQQSANSDNTHSDSSSHSSSHLDHGRTIEGEFEEKK